MRLISAGFLALADFPMALFFPDYAVRDMSENIWVGDRLY